MIRRSSLVGLLGKEREMFRTQPPDADCAIANDLLRAFLELPLNPGARVTRAHGFLNHGIQASAASLKSQPVPMLLYSRHERVVIESVRIIGQRRSWQED